MKFELSGKKYSGLLVPVYTLNSKKSEGCGDFIDLIGLGELCQKTGLDLIQLLPVNDTGSDPSPYSALSSMALQIAYIRISALPEYEKTKENAQIDRSLQDLIKSKDRFHYENVRTTKIGILKIIYNESKSSISEDSDFKKWVSKNKWVTNYSVFMYLKETNSFKSWKQWSPDLTTKTDKVIKKFENEELVHFYTWVQYRLEQQFVSAVNELNKNGVFVKGDIPILMNEDSVDVWHERENFILSKRAGAPPDMFSQLGQNWGFPIYDWDYLKQDSYSWWKRRLKQADKFYNIFRIDHVLGFFRIWSVDERHRDGVLGYFNPSIFVSKNDLNAIGFDAGRIKWLSEPHITGNKMREIFGAQHEEARQSLFTQVNNEDLYLFRSELKGELDICAIKGLESFNEEILGLFRDRALIELDNDLYAIPWFYRDCWRYKILSGDEKGRFESLAHQRQVESEKIWEIRGNELLSFIKNETPMLACAEDLGVIPDCVPRVLQNLGILSLKIPRWAKNWNADGQPFIPHTEYPYYSVCAISVHDTSTNGDWWEHEANKQEFIDAFKVDATANTSFDSSLAFKILKTFFESSSSICVSQLQDFLALSDKYISKDFRTERMNIPGTIGSHNWSWRMGVKLESLAKDTDFVNRIKTLTELRK